MLYWTGIAEKKKFIKKKKRQVQICLRIYLQRPYHNTMIEYITL